MMSGEIKEYYHCIALAAGSSPVWTLKIGGDEVAGWVSHLTSCCLFASGAGTSMQQLVVWPSQPAAQQPAAGQTPARPHGDGGEQDDPHQTTHALQAPSLSPQPRHATGSPPPTSDLRFIIRWLWLASRSIHLSLYINPPPPHPEIIISSFILISPSSVSVSHINQKHS